MPRVCDVCQNFDAILFCRADAAFLCTACDFKVHQANKLAFRHERVRVCDGCKLALADFTCKPGIAAFCVACNIKVHSANPHVGQHGQSSLVPFIVAPYVAHNDIADVQEMDFNHHAENAAHNDIVESFPVQDMGFNQCVHNAAHINVLDHLHVQEVGNIQPEYDDVVGNELCTWWLVQHDPKSSDSSKDDVESASTESKKGWMRWEEENFHLIEGFMLSDPCEENACMHGDDSLVPSLAHTSSVASNAFQTCAAGYTQGTVSQSRFLTATTNGMGVVPDVALNCMSVTKTPCLHYKGHPCTSIAREARVLRYKEKRKNRNFEKTVRYASRKAYAEARPRVNGRFAKRPHEVSKQINFACDNDAYVFSVVPSAGFEVYQRPQAI